MKMLLILVSVACSLSAAAKVEKPEILCEVVEVETCPSYGPTSYHCRGRTAHRVVCSVEANFATEEIAEKKMVEIQKVLNSQWD